MKTKKSRTLSALAAAALAAAAFAAPAQARDFQLLFGVNGSSDNMYSYIGGIVPLSTESLDKDGWLLRLWGAYQDYDYRTMFRGGAAGLPTDVNVDGWSGEIALGYQKFFDKDSRGSVYLGVVTRDLDASPRDPNDPLNVPSSEEEDTGYRLQVEGVTRSGKWELSGIASYVFEFDNYWVRGRAGYDMGQFRVGPELVFMGGDDFDKEQVGVFFDGIALGKNANLSFSVGGEYYDDNFETGWNAYGGLGVSIRF